jgi:hypothetical protein
LRFSWTEVKKKDRRNRPEFSVMTERPA